MFQMVSVFAPLVTMPYVSRVFGPEYLGTYSYIFSVAHYFVIFALLGLTNYGNRLIASVRDNKAELNKVFSEIYSMQVITAGASVLLYCGYVFLFGRGYFTYYLILLLYVVSSILDINWLFFGLEEFKFTATRSTIIKALSVIAILLFIKKKEDLWIYFLIYAASGFISCVLLWPRALKKVTLKRVSIKQVLPHLSVTFFSALGQSNTQDINPDAA